VPAEAHDGFSDGAVPDERDAVDADAALGEGVQVLAHGEPGDVHPPGAEVGALLLGDEAEAGGGGEAAVADNLGGDALAEFAVGGGIGEEGAIGVSVDVDEAGGEDEARVVDASGGAVVVRSTPPAIATSESICSAWQASGVPG
jgi:hypothetical protein